MSRIGRLPVAIPSGVQIDVQGSNVHVKGPKGEMKRTFSPMIGIAMENGQVVITRNSDAAAERALHGTTRAVIANMVHGVSSGFSVVLEVEGVGYLIAQVVSGKIGAAGQPAQREAEQRALARQAAAADEVAYAEGLRERHKVKILRSDLQRDAAGPASATADAPKK